ncbi:hypothetical protein [Nocardia sp. NPDC004860]|uniref:hypothetical protein n=1 Tax=Nocardia sp. NPDC004860 TaxID=3154557 RepID=UPI0033B6C0B5
MQRAARGVLVCRGIALGALAGGIAVDHAGPLSLLWLEGGSILAAVSILGRARTTWHATT